MGLAAKSQDFLATNPKMVKLLGDTLNTKMLLITISPGATTQVHTHPAQIVYAIQGGTLRVQYDDGRKETFTIKTGQSMTFPPDPPHKTSNIGKTTIKLIMAEVGTE